MVEYAIKNNSGIDLDLVFSSLADDTRRDILERVLVEPRTIGELAATHLKMSFAAVSKHVGVLESARLVTKQRQGRYQIVSANPETLEAASSYLKTFAKTWDARFNALDALLEE